MENKNNEKENLFNSLDNSQGKRRELLPWLIKAFCWFFMLFGGAAIICFFLGFMGFKPSLSFMDFQQMIHFH